jgi:hypothetical protein
MLTERDRIIDHDIINLSGGLFERAHVTAPAPPEPEIVASNRAAAHVQARRARRASWIVGTVAAVTVAGVAAAYQATPSAPVAKVEPSPSPRALVPAPLRGAAVMAASPPDTPDKPENTAAEAVPAAPAPPLTTARPRSTQRGNEPPVASVALPPSAPAPSLLEALAAPRTDFDRAAAAVSIAAAARSARGCIVSEDLPQTARVRVTFSTSGRATSASIEGGPLVGTAAGACLARALRGAQVHAFEGEPVAVATTVHF